ncbi:MAG: GNAT family N-acetyltransferase [Alphaproteobacteria bacterium]
MGKALFESILLTPNHSVQKFDCTSTSLNAYLSKKALSNHQKMGPRTYVMHNNAMHDNIVGYFTLAYGIVAAAPLSLHDRNKPIMLLARLAVDINAHGRGLDKILLKDALLKSLKAAKIIKIFAVVVYARDESVKLFYQQFGFMQLPSSSFHFYLSIKDIENNFKS